MRKWLWILLLAIPLLMAGCRKQQQVDESGYRIWYINQDETCLKYENKELQSKNEEGLLREMMEVMRETPTDDELKPVIPEDVELLDFDFEHNQLDLVIFLRDVETPSLHEPDSNNICMLCDMYNIPLATNLATAELLIKSLERGDMEWREIYQ